MSYESEISIVCNDYGYNLEFKSEDGRGTVVPLNFISGTSGFTYNVWKSTVSGQKLMWSNNNSLLFTVNNASGGLFQWTVPSGFFDQVGIYNSEVKCRFSGGKIITFTDLRVSVVEESP